MTCNGQIRSVVLYLNSQIIGLSAFYALLFFHVLLKNCCPALLQHVICLHCCFLVRIGIEQAEKNLIMLPRKTKYEMYCLKIKWVH